MSPGPSSCRPATRRAPIAAGALSAEQLVAGLPGAHPRGRAGGAGLAVPRRGARAGAGARARPRPRRRPAARAAARRARGHQGHHRHHRHAHRGRHRAARRPPARARCRGGGAAARGRRGDPRQDRDHRVRHLSAQQDTQPARRHALARWLVGGVGGGGGGRHGAAGDRHAVQRVDHPAGVVLRRLRLQADARTDLAPRRAQAVALARLRGPVRALARRHRAGCGAAHRLRRERSRHAPARPHSVRADAGRRAAADAACGVREDADLGARRRIHARGLRRAGGGARRVSARNTRCPRRSPRRGTGTAPSWRPRWRPISTSSTRRAATS